ncbi:zf-HC2 domain-containing protein [Streptomyces sp. NPDC051207]|uniref:zf-HC2 domain-containing protein n=1 Tax=Streptomyces sp. NPDC051207 TaxID=3154641 RepID=UPI00343089CD
MPARHALGARLFGALDGTDRSALDEHLSACGPCRADYGELGAVLPLLDLVDPGELDGVPAPDPRRAIAAVRTAAGEARPTRWSGHTAGVRSVRDS